MPAPAARYKLLPARGAYASLAAALADIAEGEIVYATDQDLYYQKEGGVLTPVGVPEAPNDGTQYVRQNQSWAAVEVPPGTIIGTSAALPGTIEIGQLWYDTETARTFVYTGTEWADASPDAANATVITADNAPANPEDGDLWFDTSGVSGRLYVYYVDTGGSQWVEASPDSSGQWVRDAATSTVSPATAGDDVDLGTGDLTATLGTFSGNVDIGSGNIQLNTDGTASFSVGGSSRISITSQGYVYFNTTTLPTGSGYGSAFVEIGSTGSRRTALYQRAEAISASAIQAFYNPNGSVGSISLSGSATAFNTSSDYRLKENVVPLTGAADRLNQLQVRRFNFIADPSTVVDGFIAHEAQAVVPECVTGTKDEVDDEGNPVYQGIDQSKLVPLLAAALQEALARIEALEAAAEL